MDTNKYLNDISEIKNMMNRSSRFISLSGLSGILAGIYALIGAYFAYQTIYFDQSNLGSYKTLVISEDAVIKLLIIAATVLILSVLTGIVLTVRKANKHGEKIWDKSTQRLIINFLIPLTTGGVLILYLIEKEQFSLIAPLTLIFYGLAIINASTYTIGDVRYLGVTLLVLAFISLWFIGYGLLFWALGFGFCHIFYGAMMYFKYERK
ncbi:hypothetical protein [Flavobacterium sp.]|jgi:hypothetical protein|uniref:hypothetical protein n=1 Tax=Flavobacterium sp. TaxID=239 RepID=UPI0037BF4808